MVVALVWIAVVCRTKYAAFASDPKNRTELCPVVVCLPKMSAFPKALGRLFLLVTDKTVSPVPAVFHLPVSLFT